MVGCGVVHACVNAGYMSIYGQCLVELDAGKFDFVRKLNADARYADASRDVNSSQCESGSEYHCLGLRAEEHFQRTSG